MSKIKLIFPLGVLIIFSCCQKDQDLQLNSGKLIELRSDRITKIKWNENELITNAEIIGGAEKAYELEYIDDKLILLRHWYNGEYWNDISFLYENERLISLTKGHGPYDPRITITSFLYNENKIIMKKDSISGYPIELEPWTVNTTSLEYDFNGNIIRIMKKDSTGLLLEETAYQYDSKINPLYNKYFVFNRNGEIDFNPITPLNNVMSIDLTSLYDDLYVSSYLTISYDYNKSDFPLKAFIKEGGNQTQVDFIYQE